ncbi:MAG: O-antigen ligase family protein [Acidobacteriia bacterium]|nr:O-antigen ligase family protein [Terriglobia bacterium]
MTRLTQAVRLFTFLSIVSIVISIAASETFLALAFLSWLPVGIKEGWEKKRIPVEWPPFFRAFQLFVVATILSVLFSVDPYHGMAAIRKLPLFFLCFLVIRFLDLVWIKRTYYSLFSLGSLAGLYAMAQFGEKWWHFQHTHRAADDPTLIFRIHAFMGHWMTFSGEQVLILATLLGCLVILPIKRTWGWVGAAVLISASVALSFTRSAWLATTAVFAVALFIARKRIVLVFPLAFLVLVAIFPRAFHDRLDSFVNTGFSSNAGRIEMAQAGWKLFLDHPWFGVGPLRIKEEFDSILKDQGIRNPPFYTGHLHNNFIQLGAERGIFALAAFVWLIVELFVRFWRGSLKDTLPVEVRAAYLAGLLSTVALVVAGLFEFNMGDSEVLILFLFLISAPYAASPSTFDSSAGSSPNVAP